MAGDAAAKVLGATWMGSGRGNRWAGFMPGGLGVIYYHCSGNKVMITVDATEAWSRFNQVQPPETADQFTSRSQSMVKWLQDVPVVHVLVSDLGLRVVSFRLSV